MKKKYLILSIFMICIMLFSVNVFAETDVEPEISGTETGLEERAETTYDAIYIKSNYSNYAREVNLFLGLHPTEQLYAKIYLDNLDLTDSAEWVSSDTSIVTVRNGLLTAVKPGTANITVTVPGATNTVAVTVYAAPEFTDFSKAKYETSLSGNMESLKISNVTPGDENKTSYYFIITKDNKKPSFEISHGQIDIDKSTEYEYLLTNRDENYFYTRNLSKYSELNQDLYLWIVQNVRLSDTYYDEEENYYMYASDFVVEGQKIERKNMPQLNLVMKSLNIGYWSSVYSSDENTYTNMTFTFPTETDNRKFTLKIGKVTDTSILTKIQNNDYSGITELLSYAKSHNSVYSQSLTTTSKGYFRSDTALFDGRSKLENKAYYYIYVVFDDENGKYFPVEGVTLGQAWFSTINDSWNLWAYTASDFSWDNLTPTITDTNNQPVDDTIAKVPLPYTGKGIFIGISIIAGLVVVTVLYRKYDYYKNLK